MQATAEAAGGLDENRNIFAQRSEGEVTFRERIKEGTIGEGYRVCVFGAILLEK